jgi:hypothetical protein
MALTNVQARDVVIGCVNAVSGGTPTPRQTLAAGGIVDAGRLQAFKANVVTSPSRGVRKFNHQFDPRTLNGIATTDLVQAVADVVRANATPATLAAGRKAAARERAARKPAARKPAAGRPSARKSSVRKSTARKTGARKSTARKAAARKSARKR